LKTCSYYRIYKKEVSFLFLPAYHGEGRADGAGSEDKLNLQAALREGVLVLGAEGMATMTNKSNDARSLAYPMEVIDRSDHALTHINNIVKYKHLKKMAQVLVLILTSARTLRICTHVQ
jgi:hypothetical protein